MVRIFTIISYVVWASSDVDFVHLLAGCIFRFLGSAIAVLTVYLKEDHHEQTPGK